MQTIKPLTLKEQKTMTAAINLLKRGIQDVGPIANDPKMAIQLIRAQIALAGAEREHFIVMFLNSRHRLLDSKVLFSGTVDGADVHPRIVIQQALAYNAAAVVLAHNHPSTHIEPSAADHALTQRLKQALALIDVRLLDHFIIAGEDSVSFAEKGWL
jgi:DNA repair protein RadC